MTIVTQDLPEALYRAAQVRAMDRYAIDTLGIPGWVLMQRAGAAAFQVLCQHWPEARRIAVLCGGGNNGGDGYVVARQALDHGIEATVFALSPPDGLQGDARRAFEAYREAGGRVEAGLPAEREDFDVAVDALLGTGLDREVGGRYADAIGWLQAFAGGVLAVDVPSGLNADSGAVMGCAVRADATVTFIGLKCGLFTGEGPACSGAVWYADLAVPQAVLESQPPTAQLWRRYRNLLPPRRATAHKGHFGHVLVVGGDAGFTGAVRMAAEAAARVGAGLVTVATRASHAAYLNVNRPEIMCHGVETPTELQTLLGRATVVAVGPGLGQSGWARSLLQACCDSGLPMIADADALNLLAQNPKLRENWILTPHPGEAARLLGTTAAEIQQDRFAALAAITAKYGGICVLKGAGTLVGGDGQLAGVCALGNPGMASGGMGDVLTGTLAGLVAQKLPLLQAARMGVCLHAAAADAAAEEGQRGMLAGDLMPWLRRLVNA
ncbi:ADP-dependent NAD(P)H-hydrate dehydratase/NAD(P)H-hydrate epimerase [Methylomarinovum tepidoasis]|uniref:Bifunctional NAD(P)H-hydrate repair enzyme n=1 Tax=Methylomarinovum tepidoasis TaxID=2840183 RepID=A0AAU9CCD6_9GAMM|nr:NAD(P)H-hydrate dehydratase [Methylomarinovum sp. IN45]BCX89627.1 ADP-dependent NAD(P)H-hydrate dehydratase/NAD(P)H-hydrate epimerase [Methylomarinovum sp. IN45]